MNDGKKLLCLESLRGLAAVVVVVHHLMLALRPDLADPALAAMSSASLAVRTLARSPIAFAWNGPLAVHLFFVLSGFVLSYSFFRTGRPDAITGPAIRRYFRLAIPSGISVVAAYGLMRLNLMHNTAAAQLTGSRWLGHWYQFTPALFGFDPDAAIYQSVYGLFRGQSFGYNNVLWTMQVELLGSFLVYATLALFGTARHRAVIYTILLLLLAVTDQINYLGFVIGMAGCDGFARRARPIEIGRFGWLLLAAGLTLGAYSGESSVDLRPLIAATLVAAAPLLSTSVRQPLERPLLIFLGRISFGLYLTHVPVIASAGSLMLLALVTAGWAVHTAAAATAVVVMAISIALGWVMFHIADRPSIAIGRRVSEWFLTPAAEPAIALDSQSGAITTRRAA